jgi:hypothetical protein
METPLGAESERQAAVRQRPRPTPNQTPAATAATAETAATKSIRAENRLSVFWVAEPLCSPRTEF